MGRAVFFLRGVSIDSYTPVVPFSYLSIPKLLFDGIVCHFHFIPSLVFAAPNASDPSGLNLLLSV